MEPIAADGDEDMPVGIQVNHAGSFMLVVALLLAFALRVAQLDSKSLWLDEIMTISVVEKGQSALWTGQSDLYHPPLYFWLLARWETLGATPYNLRLLSAFTGFLCVPLIYGLAKSLIGPGPAYTAAWFAGLAPLLIWYAQELRNYSLLLCFTLIGLTAFAKLLLQPKIRWWLLFVIGVTAALYTHYGALLLLPMQLALYVTLLAAGRIKTRIGLWGMAGWTVALLAYWPWLRTPTVGRFFDLLSGNRSFNARQLNNLLNINLGALLPILAVVIPVVTLAGLGLLFLLFRQPRSLWGWLRTNRWAQFCLVLVFLLILVMSVVPRAYTLKRQLLILEPLC